MEFNEKLQELRKHKGLTQEELAQALYVSRTAVSKWESGRGYPNLDSLKAIAVYFSVTVDDLLSGDALLTLAQDEQKRTKSQTCDRIFGLLNLSTALLFALPCFRQTADGAVQAVSLLTLSAVAPYMRAVYWVAVLFCVADGLLLLALQNVPCLWWTRSKHLLSLTVVGLSVLLCILGSQPYAAALLFAFLTIQVLLLLKTG